MPWWIATPLPVLLVAILISYVFKRRIVKALDKEMAIVPSSCDRFAKLDIDILERDSIALRSLGFRQLADLASGTVEEVTPLSNTPAPPIPDPNIPATSRISLQAAPIKIVQKTPQFVRLFVHDEHRCYAVLDQLILSSGKSLQMQCAIISWLAESWDVITGNGQPRLSAYFLRRRRVVSRRYIAASLAELLQRHLRERDEVARNLGLELVTESTLEAYCAHILGIIREVRQNVRRQNALKLFCGWVLFRRSRTQSSAEWLGDYAKLCNR